MAKPGKPLWVAITISLSLASRLAWARGSSISKWLCVLASCLASGALSGKVPLSGRAALPRHVPAGSQHPGHGLCQWGCFLLCQDYLGSLRRAHVQSRFLLYLPSQGDWDSLPNLQPSCLRVPRSSLSSWPVGGGGQLCGRVAVRSARLWKAGRTSRQGCPRCSSPLKVNETRLAASVPVDDQVSCRVSLNQSQVVLGPGLTCLLECSQCCYRVVPLPRRPGLCPLCQHGQFPQMPHPDAPPAATGAVASPEEGLCR